MLFPFWLLIERKKNVNYEKHNFFSTAEREKKVWVEAISLLVHDHTKKSHYLMSDNQFGWTIKIAPLTLKLFNPQLQIARNVDVDRTSLRFISSSCQLLTSTFCLKTIVKFRLEWMRHDSISTRFLLLSSTHKVTNCTISLLSRFFAGFPHIIIVRTTRRSLPRARSRWVHRWYCRYFVDVYWMYPECLYSVRIYLQYT